MNEISKIKKLIPFAERLLPAAEHETPVVAQEIWGYAVETKPDIRESLMVAKKGVQRWAEIGKAEILPFEERIAHTQKSVDHFMNNEWLKDLTETVKSNLGGKKKVEVVFTRAYENGSLNLIPAAMAVKAQSHLAHELPGIEVAINDSIFQASKVNRTGAVSASKSLARQQIFEGKVADDVAHVLVDEHIESGTTLKALDNHIRKNGGHVASIGTLTKNPGAEHIRILPETLKAIEKAITESVTGRTVEGSATSKLLGKQAVKEKELGAVLAN